MCKSLQEKMQEFLKQYNLGNPHADLLLTVLCQGFGISPEEGLRRIHELCVNTPEKPQD